MSSIVKTLTKLCGRSTRRLRVDIAARARRALYNAQGTPSLILLSKRWNSDSAVIPAQCPFKSIMDLPGEWEDIPFGGDHSKHYNPSGMYKYSVFGQKTLDIYSSDAAKDVFKLDGQGKSVSDWTPQIQALLGDDAVVLKYGKDHRRIRKELNPLFTDSALIARYDNIWTATDTFVQSMISETAKAGEGEYIQLYPLTRLWAWNIGMSVVLGVLDVVTEDESEMMRQLFMTWCHGMFDQDPSNIDKPGTLFGDAMIARKELLLMMDLIVEKARAKDDLDPNSALHGMLKADWTPNELRETLLNLMFATHDTTAVTTNNVVYAMHRYPKITCKLQEELAQLKKDENGKVDYDELMECPYLDGFVKESMRMKPPVYGTYRSTMEESIVNGIPIPKGQKMHINFILQGMNGDEFENPETFDPTRWMNANVPSKYAFTPFGMGPKICVGWKLALIELKIMVAQIQSKVRMEIDEERLEKAQSPFNFWEIYGRFHPK